MRLFLYTIRAIELVLDTTMHHALFALAILRLSVLDSG